MRMLENKKVTREERIMVLALNSKAFMLILSGLLTSIMVIVVLFAVLFLFSSISSASKDLFVIPDMHAIYLAIFLLVFGALTARLKTVQYALHKAAYRGSSIFDFVASGLNFIFPMAIFAFLFIMLVSLEKTLLGFQSTNIWNTSMLYLVIGLFVTMIIKQLWDFFFGNVLIMTTSIDWRLIIDKERFNHMLRLRFDESKRYPGPFTMMMVGIQDYEQLAANANRKAIIEMQERIIDFINRSVRTVDIVARLDQGQYIGVLLHTSGVEAKVPANRIKEQAREFTLSIGEKTVTPVFRFGVATFEQTMQHERELYEKAVSALEDTKPEEDIIIR